MIILLDDIIKQYDLKIKGVLHVGSHYGQEYKDYVKNGIENMIFFEPMKETFKKLEENVPTSEKVRLLNMALGNTTGVRDMFVETANKGMSSSFLEPGTHLTMYPHIKFDKKEEVFICKLDDVSFDRDLYNMINIDVQGFELEVFKGAIETLWAIDIIYTEVNFEDVYKNCCHVEDLDTFLGDFGFKRVLTDGRYGSWGDALYLREEE
jgi:FkbM family methyltransferase